MAGPTGEFPEGKINDSDEGELEIAAYIDTKASAIIMNFGTRIEWFGMGPDMARSMANHLLFLADDLEQMLKERN